LGTFLRYVETPAEKVLRRMKKIRALFWLLPAAWLAVAGVSTAAPKPQCRIGIQA
jgi:hypothetical protein